MNKLAIAAVPALAATTLTAASVVPAAGDTKVHTKRFVAHQIAVHPLDSRGKHVVFADVDRHAGHIIGYDSATQASRRCCLK
jgi:hypothetical protein